MNLALKVKYLSFLSIWRYILWLQFWSVNGDRYDKLITEKNINFHIKRSINDSSYKYAKKKFQYIVFWCSKIFHLLTISSEALYRGNMVSKRDRETNKLGDTTCIWRSNFIFSRFAALLTRSDNKWDPLRQHWKVMKLMPALFHRTGKMRAMMFCNPCVAQKKSVKKQEELVF